MQDIAAKDVDSALQRSSGEWSEKPTPNQQKANNKTAKATFAVYLQRPCN